MFSFPIAVTGSGRCREEDTVRVSVSVGWVAQLQDVWFGISSASHKTLSWGWPFEWGTRLSRSSLPLKSWVLDPSPGTRKRAVGATRILEPSEGILGWAARPMCFQGGCWVPVNESGAAVS